jgi:hypothetical protein
MPAGEGWFLAAIYDTEDGPYACYARPKASVLGSSEWLDEKLKAKGN